MEDSAYCVDSPYAPCEVPHAYGEGVHILRDPIALTRLARLCSPQVGQPAFSRLMRRLYTRLLDEVVNCCFPRVHQRVETRMSAHTERGFFSGQLVDRSTQIVSVAIARAGTVPSQVCFEHLTEVVDPANVRQDHLVMSRTTNDNEEVTGAAISGNKIGGPIDGRIVLFPDPMGATGGSLSEAITFMKSHFGANPLTMVTLNLIVTPEFIARLRKDHPEVLIFTLRLDRGMSSQAVLEQRPGEAWAQESGLTPNSYIVPGGGGFGEIMNNAFV